MSLTLNNAEIGVLPEIGDLWIYDYETDNKDFNLIMRVYDPKKSFAVDDLTLSRDCDVFDEQGLHNTIHMDCEYYYSLVVIRDGEIIFQKSAADVKETTHVFHHPV